jgi:hypothetical protein
LPVTSNGPAIAPASRPFASVEAVRFLDHAAEYRREKGGLDEQIEVAGAGGIEPCNNPLPHKDFSIPARPFDSIFDSKAKALVGMTDDEVAYIEAKGWKASVVPELSIIHHFANFCGSNAGALRSAMPDADFLQNLHLCPLLGVVRTRFAQPELFRV